MEEGQTSGVQWSASDSSTTGPFGAPIAFAVVLGLVLRIAFVRLVAFPRLPADALLFRKLALHVADGDGYSAVFAAHPHALTATATHPPLFPLLLAMFDVLALRSVGTQQIALALVSCLSVVLMGLLGREVAGRNVGIAAAFLAAVNPLWLGFVASLLSESIYLVVIPLMLLVALRCIDRPSIKRFALLGVVIGLAVLTRSEAIDFVFAIGVPALLLAPAAWKVRGTLAVSLLVGVLLIVGPWLLRNEIQVGGLVLSTNQGGTLVGSYCDGTFNPSSPLYGSFSDGCALGLQGVALKYIKPPDPKSGWTELSMDRYLTGTAETYARQHLGQLPRVVVARETAAWNLNYSNDLLVARQEGRNRSVEELTFVLYWLFFPFVVWGVAVLSRLSRRRLIIIAMPIVVVVINVATTYGSTRFRMAAEPSMVAFCAVGIMAGMRRFQRGRNGRTDRPRAVASSSQAAL